MLTGTQKKRRLSMMITGAFAIFFTGYPHVWSVYQPYVMEQAGWSGTQASMCFYLALCTFVFGNIIGGRIQDKKSPRMVLFVGGGIFAAGILLSAFLIIPSPLPVYLTYGVMQGFGQGMVYTTIISTAQKWFPKRIGFASGVVVTANGLCGFFLAPISRALLNAGGPKLAFLTIGAVIAVSWILAAMFLYVPDDSVQGVSAKEEQVIVQKQYTSKEMMQTKSFYFLLVTMLFGLISYFMLSPVSQTLQIERGIPSHIAVTAVMIGSVMNAGTRLILPSLADKVGRIPCIRGVLVVAVTAMMMLTLSRSYMTTVAIILMYGCYGGIMGSFPSLTSSIFGMEHSGENYGFVMFGIVLATFGAPAITSLLTRQGGDISTVFLLGTMFSAGAFVSLALLQRELKKKHIKKQKKESAVCL